MMLGAGTGGGGAAGAVTAGGGSEGAGSAGAGIVGTGAVGGGRVAGRCRESDNAPGSAHEHSSPTAATHSAAPARVKPSDSNQMIGRGESVAMTRGEPLAAVERTLYVVATPLGNLRDITLRALDILARVDIVAAEDTRLTGTLLARHGISTRMLSLHEHNERRRAKDVIGLLASGKSVALVSDAGTPAVSDPGAKLVRAVAEAGFSVVPIPGPSAVIAALSAAGLKSSQWLFYGFLPVTGSARRAELERVRALPLALVFYEAPHRIAAMVADVASVLGPERDLVVARELTKRFEMIHRCRSRDAPAWLAADADRQRGEFVLIVDAPEAARAATATDAHDAALAALLAELPLAQAVRLAVALTGAPKKRLYERALRLKRESNEER